MSEIMNFWRKINASQPVTIETTLKVLCLSTLIACESLPYDADLNDADKWYEQRGDCNYCPHVSRCLAVELEQ